MRSSTASAASIAVLAALSASARAEPAPDSKQLDEVIVVATLKKQQSLQDVPASVAAVSGDDLAKSGVVNSFDLQQLVPGLAISMANRETNVAIRGISNNVRSIGADPSNAVHLEGIYLPQSSMVLTEFFDVARVEVLKGPEGTLYGRNATGGVINIVTRQPEPGFGADGFVGLGNLGTGRVQAAIGGGTEAVAARFAAVYAKDDGYTRSITTGQRLDATDFTAGRGQVAIALGESARLNLLAQVSRDDGTLGYGVSTDPSFPIAEYPYGGDPAYGLTPADQRQSPRRIAIDAPIASQRDAEIYGATLEWKLGSVDLKSITGFTRYDGGDFNDFDFTGRELETQRTTTSVDSFSQELQISGGGGTAFEWITGLFYYKDDSSQFLEWLLYNEANFFGTPDPAALARLDSKNESTSKAVFAQATWQFADRWSLLVGGRYNDESKDGSTTNLRRGTTTPVSASFDKFTPKGQLQYRPSENLLFYAGVTEGFKSGGFNLFAAPAPAIFQPETVLSYEIGAKSTLADGRVRLNASAFHYDYEDLQLRTLVLGPGGPIATVSNAAEAKVNGLEASIDASLTDFVSIDLAATYLDSEFESFISPSNRKDLSGTPLPLSPEFSAIAGINAAGDLLGGTVRARVEASYRSKIIFPLSIDQTWNFDESATLLNASLRWTAPSQQWYVELVGRNLTDTLYRTQRSDVPGASVFEGFGAPRTGELRAGFSF